MIALVDLRNCMATDMEPMIFLCILSRSRVDVDMASLLHFMDGMVGVLFKALAGLESGFRWEDTRPWCHMESFLG
jgi:hypothetical protein